jgi:hypothetical protein
MGLFSGIGKIIGLGATALGFPEFGALASGSSFLSGLDGAGDILGPAASYFGQSSANSASQASSREQMQFQKDMSSTAYQRATKDMMAAGLNPMLAYSQGGASTPGGASYTAQDALSPAVKLGIEGRNSNSAISLQRAQTDSTQASADFSKAQTLKTVGVDTQKAIADTQKSMADARLSSAQALKTHQDMLGGKSDAEWAARHPNTVGFGKTMNAIFGGAGQAANSANSAASAAHTVKQIKKPAGRQILKFIK